MVVKNRRPFRHRADRGARLIRRRRWLPRCGARCCCAASPGGRCWWPQRNLGGSRARAISHRAATAAARTLVVEGWLDQRELDAAIAALAPRRLPTRRHLRRDDRGLARGVAWPTTPNARRATCAAMGVIEIPVVAVAAPATAQRAHLSHAVVRDWLRREQPGVTRSTSSRRASTRAARAWPIAWRSAAALDVGVIATTPRSYDIDHWWRTSEGAKTVLGELLSLAWTKCFSARRGRSPEGGSAQVPSSALSRSPRSPSPAVQRRVHHLFGEPTCRPAAFFLTPPRRRRASVPAARRRPSRSARWSTC